MTIKGRLPRVRVDGAKDVNGQNVLLRDIHWLNFGWGKEKMTDGNVTVVYHPNEVWMHKSFSSSEPWIKVEYLRRRDALDNVFVTAPDQLYSSPLPLKPSKVADLKKIAAQHIPPLHRGFYMALRGEGDDDTETEFTDSDES